MKVDISNISMNKAVLESNTNKDVILWLFPEI